MEEIMKDKHAQKHRKEEKKAIGLHAKKHKHQDQKSLKKGIGPTVDQIHDAIVVFKDVNTPPPRTAVDGSLFAQKLSVIANAIDNSGPYSQSQLQYLHGFGSWYENMDAGSFQSQVQKGLGLFSSQKKVA